MTPVPQLAIQSRSRQLLSEDVRRRLLVAILDGTLSAGERLHDEQLIGWLGVSRTPIRTALERLSEIGLVEMEPNRFTRVSEPTIECLVHSLQVYAALTVSTIDRVVSRFDEADLREFRRRLARVESIARRHQQVDWAQDDLRAVDGVLDLISGRSTNPLLLGFLGEVRVRLAFMFLHLSVPVDRRAVRRFVDEISSAVEGRDEEALARVVTTAFTLHGLDAATVGRGG